MKVLLAWPEDGDEDDRRAFYSAVAARLGDFQVAAIVFGPVPIGVAARIVADLAPPSMVPLDMSGSSFAVWVVDTGDVLAALHAAFEARQPELAVMVFRDRPDGAAIEAALNAADASPAVRALFFDDGDLLSERGEPLGPPPHSP